MKSASIVLATALTVCFAMKASAETNQPPVLQPYGLTTSYVPIGFDDNDNIQVTVDGYFSNSCYKVGPTAVKFAAPNIIVQQYAYKYSGMCLQIIVPFHQTVNLGILKSGTYHIVDGSSGTRLGALPVTVAKSSSADDYLYAPVSDAFLTFSNGKPSVTISGVFTDS